MTKKEAEELAIQLDGEVEYDEKEHDYYVLTNKTTEEITEILDMEVNEIDDEKKLQ